MSLLGPPDLYTTIPSTVTAETISDPFMDMMVSDFNKPHIGLTENMSPTFLTTGNPCLDFFFHVVPDTPPETIKQRLSVAWEHNPLMTLKLACNLRGVRGTGKSDKEGFYAAALWLHQNHPKTLACNVGLIADFGYFKDLPEILFRLLEGGDVRQRLKSEWIQRKGVKGRKMEGWMGVQQSERKIGKVRKPKAGATREERVRREAEKAEAAKAEAGELRKYKKVSMAKKVVERYSSDLNFRFLYDRVSDHFSECLKADLRFLNAGEVSKISLAAKWCPSLDSSFDRSTLLCEIIARKVFPREDFPEYRDLEDAHYAYRVRDRLRKDVLVPIRKVLELPEVYIGANRWDLIPYNRVASVAMKFYKDKFMKHDKERFEEYLEKVKSGKATIAAGALLPHEIIASLNDGGPDDGEVAVLQWKRMVDDLLKKGKLRNCLAVCDVSGSMNGIPMEVCVALGLLVSELSEEPWKGKIITFSENPQLHMIEGDDLRSKIDFVRLMDWGMNTNFQKVFDQILDVAVKGNLKEDQMIKKLFVFSDMEFDAASETPWETDYQAITRKYAEKGYGSAVPQIVFWNLRDSRATPVPASQNGVALVSGFSKNLLNLFLNEDGVINPEVVMEAAISGEEYQKLVVLD